MADTKIYQTYFKGVVFNIMNNLYHASDNKRLKLLQPQKTLSDDKYIGDYVFATTNKLLALMYLANRGTATLMNPLEPNPNIVICAGQSDYIKKDKGGAIYEVSNDFFEKSPQFGLTAYEMVSTKPTKIIKKTLFNKSIEALISNGIEVRFTDIRTFNNLIGNKNQLELINKIRQYKP